mmetsp:Transcript_4696/g.6803  ORF Transcript_4696/g.6803 Transcript_4696/m.6803 type:complete len:270 (-) Transcript_4696:73-882(-)
MRRTMFEEPMKNKKTADGVMLSFSPKSTSELLRLSEKHHLLRHAPASNLGLYEFINELPTVINDTLERYGSLNPEDNGIDDPIYELFSRLSINVEKDLFPFAHFDPSKNYTRNLISTDGKLYTLLLLCWNPGKESPIHDHPSDGCWMKTCEGRVRECRYTMGDDDMLECIKDSVYEDSEIAYIRDSMGYHKVGNPSTTKRSMTLHLYCPPFDKCRVWLDPTHTSNASCSRVCYHSQYGTLVNNNTSSSTTTTTTSSNCGCIDDAKYEVK